MSPGWPTRGPPRKVSTPTTGRSSVRECGESRPVFAAKTGESDEVYYQQHAPTVPRSDIGEPFDEDTVEDRYPEVAARFS